MIRQAIVSVPFFFLAACAGGPPATVAATRPVEAGGSIGSKIERALAAREVPASLEIEVGWLEPGGEYRSLELFGDGVGISLGRRQFRVGKEGLLGVLEEFLRSGIDHMDPEGEAADDDAGPRVRWKARIGLDSVSKTVIRTTIQPREEALERLVGKVREICSEPIRAGVEAASLPDALHRLKSGELAPQTLTLRFTEIEEKGDASGARRGWTLQLRGLSVEVTLRGGAGEEMDRRRSVLTARELSALVRELRQAEVDKFPGVLFSDRYEQLSVDALSHVKDFQARAFLGLTRESHPGAQKAYERLREKLEAIKIRVVADPR